MTADHHDEQLKQALGALTVDPPREAFWTTVRAGLEATTEAGATSTPRLVHTATHLGTAPASTEVPPPLNGVTGPIGGSLPAVEDGDRSPDRFRFLALAAGFCLIAGLGTLLAVGGERPAVVATDIDQPAPGSVMGRVGERFDEDDGGEALAQEAGTARFTIGQGADQPYDLEACTVDGDDVTAGLSDRSNPDHRIDLLDGELIISGGPDDVGTAEMLTVGPIVEIVGELETAGPFRLVIVGCEER